MLEDKTIQEEAEASKLQEDNRTLDQLTRSKEAALLEVEKTVEMALAKASLVDVLQNKNQELMKQIEISQEENRILDKMNRQKVAEVEKLTQTVHELEEAVLAGGAAANAVRDYQRKVQEMNEEKKILERELARAKISANRVAVFVANEWKDTNDKVMRVRQWLEEEMQQLRDKLAIAQRTAKTEAQLKEKYQLRFKVLEERLRSSSNGFSPIAKERKALRNGHSRQMSLGGVENLYRSPSNGFSARNLPSQPFHANGSSPMLYHADTSSSSSEDSTRLIDVDTSPPSGSNKDGRPSHVNEDAKSNGISKILNGNREVDAENVETERDDFVSGILYDMLQKEVMTLRKSCRQKDQSLKDKDDAIEILRKNVETLNRAMEVESKRMQHEVAVVEKEVAAMRTVKERSKDTVS